MNDTLENKKKVAITIATTVGGILLIAAIVLALLFGCKKNNTFVVKWENWNGVLLEKDVVKKGEMPEYNSAEPTRRESESQTYAFSGWTPEIVPVTKNATYRATYTSSVRTFTVTFPEDDALSYAPNIIENVPYGTPVHIDGMTIEINGVVVTAEWDLTEEQAADFDYRFIHWKISDGSLITQNTSIGALYNAERNEYHMTVVASGAGDISVNGQAYNDYYFRKTYEAVVTGGTTGEYVGDTLEVTTKNYLDNDNVITYSISNICDDYKMFYDISFGGWYYNGQRLKYGDHLKGNVEVLACFSETLIDTSNVFTYEFNDVTHECTITGINEEYTHSSMPIIPEIVIPRDYNGYTVTGIKGNVLNNIQYMHGLYIPSTIKNIEKSTHSSTFGVSITSGTIVVEEDNEYYKMVDGILYNSDMTELLVVSNDMIYDNVVIPDTVTTIWEHAFTHSFFTKITLSNNLTKIGEGTFLAISGLRDLYFTEGITEIGTNAFLNADITAVAFPSTLEVIGYGAFDTNNLTTAVLNETSLTTIGVEAFRNNTKMTHVLLPNTLESIGRDAFNYCTSLASLTFFGTVEEWNNVSLGDSWYANTSLTQVRCSNGNVPLP